MQEHLSDHQIQIYQERGSTPDQLLEIDEHLQACESCRIRLRKKSEWLETLQSLRSDLRKTASLNADHISYEQLEAFVEGKLDSIEVENIQSHLDICDLCQSEEQDLRFFHSDLNKVIPLWRSRTFYRVAAAAAVIAFFVWIAATQFRNDNGNARVSRENANQQKSPEPLLVLKDGSTTIEIDQQRHLSGLPKIPDSVQRKIVAALTKQELETPSFLDKLIGPHEILMGDAASSDRFSLIAPVGTVVQSDQPIFRWMPLKGADSYQVYIFDANYNEIAVSSPLKDLAWTTTQTLPRGATYNWQAVALRGGKEFLARVPPTPEAKFQILSKDKFQELQNMEQNLGNSHLVMGILSAQFGLLDDAEREFIALSQDNPQSPVAKKLLQKVQSLRK